MNEKCTGMDPDGPKTTSRGTAASAPADSIAARLLRPTFATWSDEASGLILLYVNAPGRRKEAPVASTKQVEATVRLDLDEAGVILGVEVIASV